MMTLKQIAEHAGVSQATVSYVLNGREKLVRISADRANSIRQLAERMDYRPNSAAKAISLGRFGSVALLQSTRPHSGFMPAELLGGILERLNVCDLHLMIAKLPDEKLRSDAILPKILREWATDGFLIDYVAGIPPKFIQNIKRRKVPSIWLNSKQDADSIYFDDFGAGRRAASELLARGHRSIIFAFSGDTEDPKNHYSVGDRYQGYCAALRAAGLPIRRLHGPDVGSAGLFQKFVEIFRGADRPSAVVTYSPYEALAAIRAAMINGLEIPGDLSAITFNERIVDFGGQALATCLLPERLMARTAVDSLVQKINDPSQAIDRQVLAFDFEPGGTLTAVSDS